jgi:hypothetical protein
VAQEVVPNHVLLLVRVGPTDAPAMVRAVKGRTARVLDDDDRLLATFVHEQLHWGVRALDERLITQLAHRYPDLPIRSPHGCRSVFSNYLHLVICSIGYGALIELVRPARARAALQRTDHYLRIYKIVMSEHDELMTFVADHVELRKPPSRDSEGHTLRVPPIETHDPQINRQVKKPAVKCGNAAMYGTAVRPRTPSSPRRTVVDDLDGDAPKHVHRMSEQRFGAQPAVGADDLEIAVSMSDRDIEPHCHGGHLAIDQVADGVTATAATAMDRGRVFRVAYRR